MADIDMDRQDDKDASLILALTADSGYESTENHRVSARQWAAILAICFGTIDAEEAMKLLREPTP